ncbi:MAG: zinc dependent phospholipase C family protein [Candidatus Thorarchaeota archaeon]
MKRKWFVLALLLVPVLPAAIISPMVQPADAWGLATHRFIVTEAMDHISNSSWAQAFQYYTPELLEGSTTPDQVWQDWPNHLYYPENGNNTAPQASARWYEFARNNFTSGNWEEGFFAAGVLSHYSSDPCIPVHTGPYWPGHEAYEHDINDQLTALSLGTPSEGTVANVSQMVVDAATYSHTYYDYIVSAYPTSESVALETNSTVKTYTELCLTMAINNTLSLFYNLTIGINAPDVTIVYEHVALFDFAHNNDYVYDDALNAVNQTLARNGYQMVRWESEINSTALTGVDLFVATCALDSYSASELSAISAWAASGNKSILLTGRGDFDTYTDNARPNQILAEIGSHIRINDDNIYMLGTYQPWYNDLLNMLGPDETAGLTENVESLTMFSPASLYFTDDGPVLPIVFGDDSAYQTDQHPPEIDVTWDDTNDGEFGYQIPLAAVEEIGSLRLLVTGTTFFSDFDYGKSQFDNAQFLENFLEWAANRTIGTVSSVDEVGPRIGDVNWTPASPANGQNVTFSADIYDPSGTVSAHLVVETDSGEQVIAMTGSGGTFTATIPGLTDESASIRVEATDGDGNNSTRAYFSITWGGSSTTTPPTSSVPLPPMTIAIAIAGVAVIAVVLIIFVRRR